MNQLVKKLSYGNSNNALIAVTLITVTEGAHALDVVMGGDGKAERFCCGFGESSSNSNY